MQRTGGATLSRALSAVRCGAVILPEVEKPLLLKDGMTQLDYIQANRGLTEDLLEEFVAFLEKGGFKFCFDD